MELIIIWTKIIMDIMVVTAALSFAWVTFGVVTAVLLLAAYALITFLLYSL